MSKTEDSTPVNETEASKAVKLVVASQVRELVKSKGFCAGGDLVEALSSKVESMLETASLRASLNGRKTLRSYDL